MSRIATRFAKLKAEGRAGLVTFITAGDPNLETSAKILAGLPKAGADLIELGIKAEGRDPINQAGRPPVSRDVRRSSPLGRSSARSSHIARRSPRSWLRDSVGRRR